MKKSIICFSLVVVLYVPAFSWGKIGHRVVGAIAEKYLTKRAEKNIQKIIGPESLAEVSNYMDFIRSDDRYDYMEPWHYATIPDGKTYEEVGTPEEGDVIVTIRRLIEEIKSKKLTMEEEAFALKCLIHLVGDIHQPLHVGNGQDLGGNQVKVRYFWQSSNLHTVWDRGIIDGQQYSYTEYAEWINHPSARQVGDWQKDSVLDWAYESMSLRSQVYDLPEDKEIAYEYDYANLEIVNRRLLQAGVRLAGILNDLYD